VSTESEFLHFDLGNMSPTTLPPPTMVCDITTVKFHTMALWIMTVSLASGFQHLKRRQCFMLLPWWHRQHVFPKHRYKPTQLWY